MITQKTVPLFFKEEADELFECDKGCGFEDSSESTVVAHEATCVCELVGGGEVAATAEPNPTKVYECELSKGMLLRSNYRSAALGTGMIPIRHTD